MIDLNRRVPRFNIKFSFLSNDLEGVGINIGMKGMGFLSTDEIVPAEDIPFSAEIKGYIFSDKIYPIKGKARILYSIKNKDESAYFHNGLEFIYLDNESKENLQQLIEDIIIYEKSLKENIANKSLADFHYYPSNDIFDKTKIFYNALDNLIHKKYEMLSYYLDSPSLSTSIFIQKKTSISKKMVMLGSNNYLGLTTHPDVIKAGKDALDKFGSGNGSGVMVGGKLNIHKELEEELADFTGKESAILYNSGYSANLGIISGLLRAGDAVINDQFNHASVFDGCLLSGAKTFIYSHNNMSSLERIMKRARLKFHGQMIVVNGIFSSNGHIAPLENIVKISSNYECRIMVDEAHALGILGDKGIGASEHLKIIDKIDIIMGTLSKSLAGVGGFAASSKDVIEYLRYYARSYLFSTSIPPSVAGSVLAALRIIRKDNSIRKKLWSNISYFKNRLLQLGLNIGTPEAAVIPIFIPDMNKLSLFSKKLFDNGVYHNVFSYPAVPLGGSLIRFGIMATHTEEELNYALNVIEKVALEEKMIKDE